MEILNDKAREIIKGMVIANYQKISVNSGACRYNFKCQHNAVHDAINEKQDKIAMCIYCDGDFPIIHFINVDKNGKYTDNTLGNWSRMYDYYLVRHIDRDSFFQVNKIFTEYRKELRNRLPFLVRILSDYEF
jgi:hypothetical protein